MGSYNYVEEALVSTPEYNKNPASPTPHKQLQTFPLFFVYTIPIIIIFPRVHYTEAVFCVTVYCI